MAQGVYAQRICTALRHELPVRCSHGGTDRSLWDGIPR